MFKTGFLTTDKPANYLKTIPYHIKLVRVWQVSIIGHLHMTSSFAYNFNTSTNHLNVFICLWEVYFNAGGTKKRRIVIISSFKEFQYIFWSSKSSSRIGIDDLLMIPIDKENRLDLFRLGFVGKHTCGAFLTKIYCPRETRLVLYQFPFSHSGVE